MKISCDAIPSISGIYLIRNNVNNKVYIGQSVNIKRRIGEGVTYKDLPSDLKKKASESAIRAIQYEKTYKHLPYYNKKLNKWIEPCIDYSPGH